MKVTCSRAQQRKQTTSCSKEIDEGKEDALFKAEEFRDSNPVALQRTVQWFLPLHFGFRERDESHMLPKIYATNTVRCPVSFYKKFQSLASGNECTRITILLGGRHNWRSNMEVWYTKALLGKNEIGKFLSTAAKNAGLHREGKKVANHSVRKTCISRLLFADVPEKFVAQLSGHKSMESLQSYKSTSAKHQKRMSLTLSRADLSGFRDEALSSFQTQSFEVVTCSTTNIAACLTSNSLTENCPEWKETSNCYRKRWGQLTLKLFFVNFVQFWLDFQSFKIRLSLDIDWLHLYFVIKKILFDRQN